MDGRATTISQKRKKGGTIMNDCKFDIDILSNDKTWGNVKIYENDALISMYEGGEIARTLFFINREQARKLVKVLDAFAHDRL